MTGIATGTIAMSAALARSGEAARGHLSIDDFG
jgi:hypothetical protein